MPHYHVLKQPRRVSIITLSLGRIRRTSTTSRLLFLFQGAFRVFDRTRHRIALRVDPTEYFDPTLGVLKPTVAGLEQTNGGGVVPQGFLERPPPLVPNVARLYRAIPSLLQMRVRLIRWLRSVSWPLEDLWF